MTIEESTVPLQEILFRLPPPFRRIKIAKMAARILGAPYQRVLFPEGMLIGNITDSDVANSLVKKTFGDYGYYQLADSILKGGDTHVDLGANYGFHTFGLMNLPQAETLRFIAIDANPDCVGCLQASKSLYPNRDITVLHAAATSGDVSELRFAYSPSTTGQGSVGTSQSHDQVEVVVPAKTLDELLAANNATEVGLLKMDIEGSEPAALRGLAMMLSAYQVDAVYFEVNPPCLKEQGERPASLFHELYRHGYRIFWPHADVSWIEKTYGKTRPAPSDLRRYTILRSQPHEVIEFDPAFCREDFGQCDLLAVSPKCPIERVS